MKLSRKLLKTLLHYDPETGYWTRLKSATRADLVGKLALAAKTEPIRALRKTTS
jgi:hypothetical protein